MWPFFCKYGGNSAWNMTVEDLNFALVNETGNLGFVKCCRAMFLFPLQAQKSVVDLNSRFMFHTGRQFAWKGCSHFKGRLLFSVSKRSFAFTVSQSQGILNYLNFKNSVIFYTIKLYWLVNTLTYMWNTQRGTCVYTYTHQGGKSIYI